MQIIKTIIGKEYPDIVIPIIDQAKKSLDIIVFDWRWYSDNPKNPVQLFNQSVVRAISRGVSVSACVNFPYSIDILQSIGVNVSEYKHAGIMHSKILIIDKKDIVIGSHNFTQSAFTNNVEVSVYIQNYEDIDILINLLDNIKK